MQATPALQIRAGNGISITPTATGEKEIAVDSTILQTRAAAQAGLETLCLGSGTAASQICSMSPILGAYIPKMRIRYSPSITNTGASVLSIDGLSAKAIKAPDGVADPAAGALVAGTYHDLTYDGSVFRMQWSPAALITAGWSTHKPRS